MVAVRFFPESMVQVEGERPQGEGREGEAEKTDGWPLLFQRYDFSKSCRRRKAAAVNLLLHKLQREVCSGGKFPEEKEKVIWEWCCLDTGLGHKALRWRLGLYQEQSRSDSSSVLHASTTWGARALFLGLSAPLSNLHGWVCDPLTCPFNRLAHSQSTGGTVQRASSLTLGPPLPEQGQLPLTRDLPPACQQQLRPGPHSRPRVFL